MLVAHPLVSYAIYPFLAGFCRYGNGPWLNRKLLRNKEWLDFGAGNGALTIAHNELFGRQNKFYDPYAFIESPFRVLEIGKLKPGTFDLITASHSLEHVSDPEQHLNVFKTLLRPGGKIVIRVPIITRLWSTVIDRWAQLDPPRHRSVPTKEGLHLLLERQGFSVEATIFDGNEFPWLNLIFKNPTLASRNVARVFRVLQGFSNVCRVSDQVTVIARLK
jgi:SAM-dependent methyltransferase